MTGLTSGNSTGATGLNPKPEPPSPSFPTLQTSATYRKALVLAERNALAAAREHRAAGSTSWCGYYELLLRTPRKKKILFLMRVLGNPNFLRC